MKPGNQTLNVSSALISNLNEHLIKEKMFIGKVQAVTELENNPDFNLRRNMLDVGIPQSDIDRFFIAYTELEAASQSRLMALEQLNQEMENILTEPEDLTELINNQKELDIKYNSEEDPQKKEELSQQLEAAKISLSNASQNTQFQLTQTQLSKWVQGSLSPTEDSEYATQLLNTSLIIDELQARHADKLKELNTRLAQSPKTSKNYSSFLTLTIGVAGQRGASMKLLQKDTLKQLLKLDSCPDALIQSVKKNDDHFSRYIENLNHQMVQQQEKFAFLKEFPIQKKDNKLQQFAKRILHFKRQSKSKEPVPSDVGKKKHKTLFNFKHKISTAMSHLNKGNTSKNGSEPTPKRKRKAP